MPKIVIEVTDTIYEALERLAKIKGCQIEDVIIDAVKIYASIIRDIDAHYRFKYERIPEMTAELLKASGISADPWHVARIMARLAKLLINKYGRVPREVPVSDVPADIIAELGRIGAAFGVEVRDGKVRLNNPALVEMYRAL